MIIGLTGLARAGKEEFAEYLVEKYNFVKLDFFENVLKDELKKRNLGVTRMNASILGDQMRKEEGMGVMVRRLFDKIDFRKNTVITGFRSVDEVKYIMEHCKGKDCYLVEVYADEDVRFERTNDGKTKDEFLERDERDIKTKGLGKVIKMAEFKIVNNSTPDELYKNIDKFMEKIGAK